MHFADQLTLARAFSVPVVVVLFAWDFPNHYYWATAVFALAMTTDYVDGWWARRTNRSSNLGRLLDPVADKLLVMAALIMLVGVALPRGWSPRSSRASSSCPGCGSPRSSAGS